MTHVTRSRLLETALLAAARAGQASLPHFGSGALRVETKRDGSAVTVADREAERAMRRVIDDAFPGDPVLGEEFAAINDEALDPDAPRQWVIDPIDGTASFVHGVPLFGVLVSVLERGEPTVGVIHFPALGQTVYAARGSGAWSRSEGAGPVPARVSGTTTLADAMVCTTSDDYFRMTQTRPVWNAVRDACASTRGWSDCYALALLATGRIDAVVEPPLLHPWDAAAAIPVVLEAGGVWTDWDGVCAVDRRSVAAAANALLHADLLRTMGEAGRGA